MMATNMFLRTPLLNTFYIDDGGWSNWSDGDCSKTCGVGTKQRTRICNNPAPSNNGKQCPGLSKDSVNCNEGRCPGKYTLICQEHM